jgi:hypothetical protein
MSELFRIPGNIALDPTSASRVHRGLLFGIRFAFLPSLLLTFAALALHAGAWRIEFKIAGPFGAETYPARHSLKLAVPQEGRAAWWRQPLLGDDSTKPFRSFLELRIDDREMGPPHSLHETIRDGTTAGFSHWGPDVIFSLPPGIRNAPETIAMVSYGVRPRGWVIFALAILSTLLGCLRYHEVLRSLARRSQALAPLTARYARLLIPGLVRIPSLIMLGLCVLGLIGSVVYVASSLYALVTGWALPTTALIRWSSIAQWAASNEPYFGYVLLTCAGSGTIVAWLAGLNLQHRRSIESDERMLRSFLVRSGFPIAAGAFVFCISAMWAGLVRPGDFDYANIGGLVPFSDAHFHFAAAHDQARDGTWMPFAQRRPIAAAAESVLLFSSYYSLPIMLILQACLLAAAACFAAHAVAMWRGIWAGIAFFGLTYIYARTFVPTTLTEPSGLFWALVSIPFFIEALRSGSVKPALVAFAMTAVALMTRMGSMFTIPVLLIWLVWQFGQGSAAKLRIGVMSVGILLGVLALNALLQKAYGTGEDLTGSNFSYVLCGLTAGAGWEECPAELAAEGQPLKGNEAAASKQLYSLAEKKFRARPEVFFRRLADGVAKFASEFPDVIWRGYRTAVDEPDWLFRNALTAISLMGLVYIAARRAKPLELSFWTLLWTSIVVSSSMVYFDDGPRTLAASHPLMALFFAIGMSSPQSVPSEAPLRLRLWRYGCLGLVVAAVLFVCVPWIAHRFSPIGAMVGDRLVPKQDEAFVFGGRRMSGFLVVKDDQPLRSDVPTLHLADFEALIRESGVEYGQGLLHPVTPPLPFGFVFAPRLEKGLLSANQFIVPAYVIERRNVSAWYFRFEPWHHAPSDRASYWIFVTKAEPWPLGTPG